VILLVIILEALRRAGKEYDRYIVAQKLSSMASAPSPAGIVSSASSADGAKNPTTHTAPVQTAQRFRPTLLQQAIRAAIHMATFAVAYFVMLLAMYYNGYIIISIFIGAYIGYFLFGYESFVVGAGGQDRMQENATVCCG
jgi:copper transporter 1